MSGLKNGKEYFGRRTTSLIDKEICVQLCGIWLSDVTSELATCCRARLISGGDDGSRTHDLGNANAAL